MDKKTVYLLITGSLIVAMIALCLHHHAQRYTPAGAWYQAHKNEIGSLANDPDGTEKTKRFYDRQPAVKSAEMIDRGIWELRFYVQQPETTDCLIVADKPFDPAWLAGYFGKLRWRASDEPYETIAETVCRTGTYRIDHVGTYRPKGWEGYIEYTLLDPNCLYCRMYVPT